MAQATADFETGTNGNALSTGDTGSATAFDAVNAFAGNTIKYDNTHTYDTLACKCDNTPNSASVAVFEWSTAIGTLTDWYGRVYLYATANPSAGETYRFVSDVSNSNQGIRIKDDGTVQVLASGGIQVALTTNSIALNQWVRIEWHLVHSATVGQWELKLFNSPDSTTPTETKTTSANLNTGADSSGVWFGLNSGGGGGGTGGGIIWLDNAVAGAMSYPGPAGGAAAQTILVSADSVDGAWTDQANGTSLAAAIDEATASDTDFVRSEEHPSSSGCRVKLASGTDPMSSDGHILHWRVRKVSATGETINGTVKLYQGGGDSQGAGTLIASFDRANVDGSAWTTYDETLSSGEADAITDYSDLYLEFFAATA